MGCFDAVDESCERCECYNWEKKLTAFAAGLIFGTHPTISLQSFASRSHTHLLTQVLAFTFLFLLSPTYSLAT